MAEESIFESAIGILESAVAAGSGEDPAVFPLSWLSDLGTEQIRKLAKVWGRLPAPLRRDLMARMDEEARENFELDFTAIARHALADEDAEVRGHAIRALWECEDIRLADRFLQMMGSDPDPLVQACAAEALGSFVERAELEEISPAVGSRMVEELIRVIRGKGSLDLRCKAVESIGYSSQTEVPALLRAASRQADESMRISAVKAMGRTADPDWAGLILPELKSRSARMRAEAAHAAGELNLREAIPVLAEMLEDPEWEVRREAIGALGEIGGASARKALAAFQNRADEDEEAELIEEALENAEFQESLGDLAMLDQDADEDDDISEEDEEDDDEEDSEDEE